MLGFDKCSSPVDSHGQALTFCIPSLGSFPSITQSVLELAHPRLPTLHGVVSRALVFFGEDVLTARATLLLLAFESLWSISRPNTLFVFVAGMLGGWTLASARGMLFCLLANRIADPHDDPSPNMHVDARLLAHEYAHVF